MNGGRAKWLRENRPTTKEVPAYSKTDYRASEPDPELRAFRENVFKHLQEGKPLVDVRSPQEFKRELLHMPDYPQEGAMRGGHIPGAVNIPWSQATNEDGTFKDPEALKAIYQGKRSLRG
jgi:thiosulfate/3-mercaptopyruvate sulfurtransferase